MKIKKSWFIYVFHDEQKYNKSDQVLGHKSDQVLGHKSDQVCVAGPGLMIVFYC